MKHLNLSVILLGVMLVFAGCDLREVEVPTPISPIGSEYHNYNNGILFTWQSVEGALIYSLEIASDDKFDAMLFSDSTIDAVSCVIPIDSLDWDSTYYWRVRASDWRGWGEWSEPVNFTFKLGFDLDTTYFPFGLGREWRYERHHYGYDSLDTWDYYDTLTIRVTDSIWIDGVLHITLDTNFALLENPIRIWESNKIEIKGYMSTTVLLEPYSVSMDTEGWGEPDFIKSIRVYYLMDTLAVVSHQTLMKSYSPDETNEDSLSAKFIKRIGPVVQRILHKQIADDSTVVYEAIDYNLIPFSIPHGQHDLRSVRMKK